MNNYRFIFLFLALAIVSSCIQKHDRKPLPDDFDTYPLEIKALFLAYRDSFIGFSNDTLYLKGGETLPFGQSSESDSHLKRLDSTTIKDMFHHVYPLGGLAEPPYLFDPGRYRNDALFKAMYGHSEKEVKSLLKDVNVFGTRMPFSTVNGAADSLRLVISEIRREHPDMIKCFTEPGTFYWRPVRGARRMSAHSYGIAIDMGYGYSDYWLSGNWKATELDTVVYKNRIPQEIITIFEKHGFISGARWYHYDTMHFEFRPEMIYYSKLSESNNKD